MAGPNPTFQSAFETQGGTAVAFLEEVDAAGNSNSPNFLDLYDAVVTNLDGEVIQGMERVAKGMLRNISSILSPASIRNLLRPMLREAALRAGITGIKQNGAWVADAELLTRLHDWMHVQGTPWTINSRGMTLSQPTGSTTGSGSVLRLTVNKYAYPLEAVGPQTLTMKVVADQLSGARKHAEQWEVTGPPRDESNLEWAGDGTFGTLDTVHPGSGGIIRNPSWDTNGASSDDTAPSSTTSITDWTLDSTSNIKLRNSSTYVFQGDYPGGPATSTNRWGLEFEADNGIGQTILSANKGAALDPDAAYFCRVAIKRIGTLSAGTVTLRIGTITEAKNLSAVGTSWESLYIALDEDVFYENFMEDDLDVRIDVASMAGGGTLAVDAFVLTEMTNVNGHMLVVDGGDTPFVKGDSVTMASSDGGSRGKFSYWLWRGWGPTGLLPTDNSGTETISDPA